MLIRTGEYRFEATLIIGHTWHRANFANCAWVCRSVVLRTQCVEVVRKAIGGLKNCEGFFCKKALALVFAAVKAEEHVET